MLQSVNTQYHRFTRRLRTLPLIILVAISACCLTSSSYGQLTPQFNELWHTSTPNAIVDALGLEDGSTLVGGSVVRRDADGNEHYHAILQKFDADYELLWEWTNSDPDRIERVSSFTLDPYGRIVLALNSRGYLNRHEERRFVTLSAEGVELKRITPQLPPNTNFSPYFSAIVADSALLHLQVVAFLNGSTGAQNMYIAYDTLGNIRKTYADFMNAPYDIQFDESSNTVLTYSNFKDLQISYDSPSGLILGQQILCLDANCQIDASIPLLRSSYFIKTNEGIRFPKLEVTNDTTIITSLQTFDRDGSDFTVTNIPLEATYPDEFKSLRPWGLDSLLIETQEVDITTYSIIDLQGKAGGQFQGSSYLNHVPHRSTYAVIKEETNTLKHVRYLDYLSLEKYSSIIDATISDTINPYIDNSSYIENRTLGRLAPHPYGFLVGLQGSNLTTREIKLQTYSPNNNFELEQTFNIRLNIDTANLSELYVSNFEIRPESGQVWAEFIISLTYYAPGTTPEFERILLRIDKDFQVVSSTQLYNERANTRLFADETSTLVHFPVLVNNTGFFKLNRVRPNGDLIDAFDKTLTIADPSSTWSVRNFAVASNKCSGITERITSNDNQIRTILSVFDSIGSRLFYRSASDMDILFLFDSLSNLITFSINTPQTLEIKAFSENSSYVDSTSTQIQLPSTFDTIFQVQQLDSDNLILALGNKNDDFITSSNFILNITTTELIPLPSSPGNFSMAYNTDIKVADYGYTIQGHNITDRLALVFALENTSVNTSEATSRPNLFSLSPNPSNGGELSIKQLGHVEPWFYDLITSTGMVLYQNREIGATSSIRIPEAAGIYFVRITDVKGNVSILRHVVR